MNCTLQITWSNKGVAPNITLGVMDGYQVKRQSPLMTKGVLLPKDYSAYL